MFFGRFVALLRILAGPLAGALHVPYRKFLIANATGGIVWAFGTAFVIYYAGRAAEKYLKGFSWIALVVAILFGIGTTHLPAPPGQQGRTQLLDDDDPTTDPSPVDEIAADSRRRRPGRPRRGPPPPDAHDPRSDHERRRSRRAVMLRSQAPDEPDGPA